MPTIDVSQFPLHDYAHTRFGLPIFALRNWTGMSFGVALFGVMLQEKTIAPGQQVCLVIDGQEYPSQIINITRATDEYTVVYTEAQTLEAGEITHLTIEHISCSVIKSGPVLLYLITA